MTYNSHPWIMFSFNWSFIIGKGSGGRRGGRSYILVHIFPNSYWIRREVLFIIRSRIYVIEITFDFVIQNSKSTKLSIISPDHLKFFLFFPTTKTWSHFMSMFLTGTAQLVVFTSRLGRIPACSNGVLPCRDILPYRNIYYVKHFYYVKHG